MNALYEILQQINKVIWGVPMLILLMGTHFYFTFKLKFIQKKTFKAIRLSVKSENKDGVSGFQALATTLAATLEIGRAHV